jgi:hypothetical protein
MPVKAKQERCVHAKNDHDFMISWDRDVAEWKPPPKKRLVDSSAESRARRVAGIPSQNGLCRRAKKHS